MLLRSLLILLASSVLACSSPERPPAADQKASVPSAHADAGKGDRKYLLERVGDAAVVQVYADGFEQLPLNEKQLVWRLYQAAVAGRDIFYDQRYRHNLEMRDLLEEVLTHSSGIESGTLAKSSATPSSSGSTPALVTTDRP